MLGDSEGVAGFVHGGAMVEEVANDLLLGEADLWSTDQIVTELGTRERTIRRGLASLRDAVESADADLL